MDPAVPAFFREVLTNLISIVTSGTEPALQSSATAYVPVYCVYLYATHLVNARAYPVD